MESKTTQIIKSEKTNKEYETRKDIALIKKQKQITEKKPKKEKQITEMEPKEDKGIFEIYKQKKGTEIIFHNSLIGVHEKVELAGLDPNVFIQHKLKDSLKNINLEEIKQIQKNIKYKQNRVLSQQRENLQSAIMDMKYITIRKKPEIEKK